MAIELTANDIYEKKFKNALTAGYSKNDVDEYLDVIIQDYESYENQVKELQEEIARLKRNQTSTNTQQTGTAAQHNTQLHANYDVLKRVSNLEKAVFGQKANEE